MDNKDINQQIVVIFFKTNLLNMRMDMLGKCPVNCTKNSSKTIFNGSNKENQEGERQR